MGIFDSLRDSIKNRSPQVLGPRANIGSAFQQSAGNDPFKINQLALNRQIAEMGAIRNETPNMPNLQGIGGIPGLQNIDFSNLPLGS